MHISSPISRIIEVEKASYLYFGGTAYLGIPQHMGFRNFYIEGLNRFGLNNGTSRSNNIQLSIYDEAEQFAAAYFGAKASLITSSGYLAAQLTVKNLLALGEVRYAPDTHPALWLTEAPKTDQKFDNWSRQLVEEINQSKIEKWIIISNSLNNLYPKVYDFSFVKDIKQDKNIVLVVDDSHGIGILNEGKGIISVLPKSENVEIVVVASMAKALGVDAGIILGSNETISLFKESHEFLGASPPSAAGLFAFINSSEIYKEEHRKLKLLTEKLGESLAIEKNWTFIPNFPVFLSDSEKLADELKKQGILISSFAYPTKNGRLINRVVISSWHKLSDIEELILALPKTGPKDL